jgi:hypothetical protein
MSWVNLSGVIGKPIRSYRHTCYELVNLSGSVHLSGARHPYEELGSGYTYILYGLVIPNGRYQAYRYSYTYQGYKYNCKELWMYTVPCMYCLNTANTRKCVYYVYYSIPRTMHCPHSLHCPALVSVNYVYYSTVFSGP